MTVALAVRQVAPTTQGVAVHVHRCGQCRGQRCDGGGGCEGVREGWLARRKVLEMLREMFSRFVRRRGAGLGGASLGGVGGVGGGTRAAGGGKRFFFKLDADAVVLPHSLLSIASELDELLGPRQRYLLGMAACRVTSSPLCHAAGGAGYGLSRASLRALHEYSRRGFPPFGDEDAFLAHVDELTYGGEDVTVAFALKKAAGVAVINCGSFYQHDPLKYLKMHAKREDWVRWPLSSTPVTFHKFKDARALRLFFACSLYSPQGQARPFPRALFAHLYNTSDAEWCADPWRLRSGEAGTEVVAVT